MTATVGCQSPSIPPVTDSDIDRAEQYLGVSFDSTRREILRSNDRFDVQACPGSGKTTLLVAKLMILAEHWPYTRRGICVLSHTNVAREEVESKLAKTMVGRQLLTYPHFIGTIQTFVNQFLALPLLRSEGQQVHLIDDELHGEYCKKLLCSNPAYATARYFLENQERNTPHRTIRALRYEGSNLRLGCAAGKLPCSVQSKSGKILGQIKKAVTDRGYWRFDDMFAWAERLLARHAEVIEFTRWRFPVVFMDEAQDTSELQAHVLATIFPDCGPSIRQRFGDANQAIYDFGQEQATTDSFPARDCRSLPNSLRFGPGIATKAVLLAVEPTNPSLLGEGPRRNALPGFPDSTVMPHTVFLFRPDSVRQVLPAFGKLLLQVFPDEVLHSKAFLARAVGWVGKSRAGDQCVPRDLRDYWEQYDPQIAKPEPKPQYLADYIHIAQLRRAATTDCAQAVQMVGKGIRELITTVQPSTRSLGGYAAIWEALRKDEVSAGLLRRLFWNWCVEARPLVDERWPDMIQELRRALRPIIGSEWNPEAETFCQWSTDFAGQLSRCRREGPEAPNRFRFCEDGRYVDIDVGTIHSAKGQTHTATLVVETYSRKHDLQDLLSWICGKQGGPRSREGPKRTERMRLIYTAMTRPSYLLCLAMRREAIGEGPEAAEIRDRLKDLGWVVRELQSGERSQ